MSHVPLLSGRPALSGQAPEVALRRILWACDFSACSVSALRFVIPVARAFGSEITALHVMPTTLPAGAGAASLTNPVLLQPHLHHDVALSLGRYVAPAVEASVPTRIALREGKPVDEVLALAASLPADLIAVGTHGQGAFERSVLGSVVQAILGKARCPVLAVPIRALPPPETLFKTVLWATDFSSHAARAQPYALALAATSHARLLLVHVLEGDTIMSDDERRREAVSRLQETVAAGREAGCETEAIVASGNASREVVHIARTRAAGLIVMGVEGSHALHTLLFGSTTHRVVRDAPCAVLAVRQT